MPSHIDVLCGHYRNSVVSNLTAVQADRRFVEREGPLNFYSLYRAHDLHFVVYSAMFEGQFGDRAAGRRRTRRSAHPGTAGHRVAADGGLAGSVRAVAGPRAGALRTMGRADRQTAARRPRPVLHHRGHHPLRPRRRARRDGTAAAGARRAGGVRRGLRAHPGHPLPVQQHRRDILAIAAEMLDGEIAYREGRFDEAFAHLRRAIELDDALPYDEPWGWMQPTRHAYGALLLEQGRVEEAAAGVRRRPRARPHAEPALPASRQRVEPARLPRMPAPARPRRRGGHHRPAAGRWRRPAPTCRSGPRARAGSMSPNRSRPFPARSRPVPRRRSPATR